MVSDDFLWNSDTFDASTDFIPFQENDSRNKRLKTQSLVIGEPFRNQQQSDSASRLEYESRADLLLNVDLEERNNVLDNHAGVLDSTFNSNTGVQNGFTERPPSLSYHQIPLREHQIDHGSGLGDESGRNYTSIWMWRTETRQL